MWILTAGYSLMLYTGQDVTKDVPIGVEVILITDFGTSIHCLALTNKIPQKQTNFDFCLVQ